MPSIDHSNLRGQHAFLSPSNYHWLNYSDEKLIDVYRSSLAVQRGTELHDLAYNMIRLNMKAFDADKTFNMYVNDAIGFATTPEKVLYYSDNCFGTADALSFRDGFLRIHDLKTGKTPAHMEQLEIYAALFCLQEHIKPSDLEMELRIYQNDEIIFYNPSADEILQIMKKIKHQDKIINKIKEE